MSFTNYFLVAFQEGIQRLFHQFGNDTEASEVIEGIDVGNDVKRIGRLGSVGNEVGQTYRFLERSVTSLFKYAYPLSNVEKLRQECFDGNVLLLVCVFRSEDFTEATNVDTLFDFVPHVPQLWKYVRPVCTAFRHTVFEGINVTNTQRIHFQLPTLLFLSLNGVVQGPQSEGHLGMHAALVILRRQTTHEYAPWWAKCGLHCK